jgi:hypothetical protein
MRNEHGKFILPYRGSGERSKEIFQPFWFSRAYRAADHFLYFGSIPVEDIPVSRLSG